MEYVTSDYHLGHIKMCGPNGFLITRLFFKDVEEMNNLIMTRHNAVVHNDDTTIHLGDLSLNQKPEYLFEQLKKMNGHFIFVKGNHDSTKQFKYLMKHNYLLPDGKLKFLEFHDVGFKRKANGNVIMFTHYPLVLGEKRINLRNLCGHIHEFSTKDSNQLNVGIDSPEIGKRPFGEPIPLEEAYALIDQKYANWLNKKEST